MEGQSERYITARKKKVASTKLKRAEGGTVSGPYSKRTESNRATSYTPAFLMAIFKKKKKIQKTAQFAERPREEEVGESRKKLL